MKRLPWIITGIAVLVAIAFAFHHVQQSAYRQGHAEATASEQEKAKAAAAAAKQQADTEKAAAETKARSEGETAGFTAGKTAAEAEAAAKETARLAQLKADEIRNTPPPGKPPYGTVRVLLVATNYEGSAVTPALKFAVSGAEAAVALLKDKFKFTTTTLLGPDATQARIKEELKTALAQLTPDDDFLFYFIGHGTTLFHTETSRTGLLLPQDAAALTADNATQQARGIEIGWVMDQLKASRGRHRIAVLDSCFSGLPPIPAAPQAAEQPATDDPLSRRSVQLITAGGENERVFEIERLKSGIFSYEFRRALEAENAGPQSLIRIFFTLRDTVTRKPEYITAVNGRLGSPQHRKMEDTGGDFVFVLPADYGPYQASLKLSARVAGWDFPIPELPGTPGSPVISPKAEKWDVPISDEETRRVLAQQQPPPQDDAAKFLGELQNLPVFKKVKLPPFITKLFGGGPAAATPTAQPPAPTLTAAERRRYQARAAVGDPNALAVLSFVDGRSTDATTRSQARDYAFTAYETGGNSGKLALGLAYTQGYNGTKSPATGAALINESGLKDLVPWIATIALAAGGLQDIKSKDPQTQMRGALSLIVAGKGLITAATNANAKPPIDKLSERFTKARTALSEPKPDFTKALKEIDAGISDVSSDTTLETNAKAGLLAAATTLREACDNKDAPGALKLIEGWFANLEKEKAAKTP